MSWNLMTEFKQKNGEDGLVHVVTVDVEGGEAVEVTINVSRGKHTAVYSDLFGDEGRAFKWAEDVIVAYGGYVPFGCRACMGLIWPWEAKHQDYVSDMGVFYIHTNCPHMSDHCPACGKRIVDTDEDGLELVSGQRWCLDHVTTGHQETDEHLRKVRGQFARGIILKFERDGKLMEIIEAWEKIYDAEHQEEN